MINLESPPEELCKLMDKHLIERFGEKWVNLHEDKKTKIYSNFYNKYIKPELEDINKVFGEVKLQNEKFKSLMVGTFLGIIGGLVASIIDRHLMTIGLIYESLILLAFLAVCIAIRIIHVNQVNKTLDNNRNIRLLIKVADRELKN